jgi:hypothetical protein
MASVVAQVCDAVLTVVKSLDLGTEFEAVRSYADYDDESALREVLRVEVVMPAEPVVSLDTRGGLTYLIDVSIGIRKRITGEDRDAQTGLLANHQLDSLVDAVERIANAMIPDVFADVDASWQQTTIDSLFDRERLRSAGMFEAQVTVTFEARKALAS